MSENKPLSVLVTDRRSYEITYREFTDQGYLKVPGKVARTGIQTYTARELGLHDRDPDERVRVYRPPEEVFGDGALQSYDHVDVTNDHPSDMVTADSFKDVAVGHAASSAYRDGDYVVVDLMIKDKNAIQAVQDGKAALSAGYAADYLYEPGTTEDGESYEFVQRNIRINHIALVDKARAGPQARLYDQDGGTKMSGTVTLDKATGSTVEVADDATAKLIQQTLDGLRGQVSDAEQRAKDAESEKEELEAKKDKLSEEKEELEKKASDEAIEARIKSVNDALVEARKVAGDEFTCDSVDPMKIRREALRKVRPTVDWDDKSDAYVQAAWDMQTTQTEDEAARQSHDGVGDDLRRRYETGDGQMAGTQAYNSFLHPEAKH